MVWESRRDSTHILAVYTQSNHKSYKQNLWSSINNHWCLSTLLRHHKILKISGQIIDYNVYRIAHVIVDSLLKNFQNKYDLYCRYWFAFFQCLLGATKRKKRTFFAQNYQEFHNVLRKNLKPNKSYICSKVLILVWHKCWSKYP
jgi:hypothetical protein